MLKPNPFNWISVPATDLDRAIAFYNAVFDLSLEKVDLMGNEMTFFSMDPEAHGATGAISVGPEKPGEDGAIPFFGCNVDLQQALDRVTDAGGEVLAPKFPIGEHGFIAFFRDSEGNKIGLHSEA